MRSRTRSVSYCRHEAYRGGPRGLGLPTVGAQGSVGDRGSRAAAQGGL